MPSNLTAFEAEALRLYGLPQEAVDALDRAIPAAERLVELVTKAQPLLTQANAELALVLPAAQAIRAFLLARNAPRPPLPNGDYAPTSQG